jgi:MPBQ/MSBQ methyltransferase
MPKNPNKIDTRAIGLDVGLKFIDWLTGAENLHYGLWTGLDLSAGNLGKAQDAYTDKLFGLLPEGQLRILDIGGGAGETAKKLLALGHTVEIVVPSAFLAERCRQNAPDATVHETTFETFEGKGPYDLCLFSESFQYIPMPVSLPRCLELVKPGGHVLIADCFRSEEFRSTREGTVGGGHSLQRFRDRLAELPFETQHEEDITQAVAPSIDLEQSLFHVFGHALTRIDQELTAKRPRSRWMLGRALNLAISERRRFRLMRRLTETTRTAEIFCRYNRYLMLKLRAPG